jgi:hypothetical protein
MKITRPLKIVARLDNLVFVLLKLQRFLVRLMDMIAIVGERGELLCAAGIMLPATDERM